MCNQAPPLSIKDGNRVHRRTISSRGKEKRKEAQKKKLELERNEAYDALYDNLTDEQKDFTGPFEFNYSGLTKRQARKANRGLNVKAAPFVPSRSQFFQPPVNGFGPGQPFQVPPQNQFVPQLVNGYGPQQPFQVPPQNQFVPQPVNRYGPQQPFQRPPRNQSPQRFQQRGHCYGPQPPFQIPPQNHTYPQAFQQPFSGFVQQPAQNLGRPVSRPPSSYTSPPYYAQQLMYEPLDVNSLSWGF